MPLISDFEKEMKGLANEKQAKVLSKFFKTGKGQYGEGDIFLGIKVPVQRKVAKKYLGLGLEELELLLSNKIHEYRLCALLILVQKFEKADEGERKKIFEFYMKNSQKINNWDLVDLSAPNIAGEYLVGKKDADKILSLLAASENLWQRRISMLATFAFIRRGEFGHTLKIAKMLLNDRHDLMHKAVGWMLRETGKRGGMKEVMEFLDRNYKQMPRTMLRYAIERLDEGKKRRYMKK